MDCTVLEVARSWTRLSDFHFHFHTCDIFQVLTSTNFFHSVLYHISTFFFPNKKVPISNNNSQ